MSHPSRLTRERARAVLAGLAVLLAASLVGAAMVGGVPIDFARAFDFADRDSPDFVILFRSRLPRVMLGAAVGGGLAASGAALQALLRNPLASPDVIGISGGASVGAIAVLALGVPGPAWIVVPGAAFVASVATLAMIVRLSTTHGRLNPYSLLLVGVIANTIAAALIMLVTSLVDSLRAQGVLIWLSGSLAQRPYSLVAVVSLFCLVPAVILWRNTVLTLPHPDLMWRVIAMSSTFAGNLLLIGSMANLIVAERAETRGVRIGFGEYARIGVPVTLLTLAWGVVVLVVTG